MSNVKERPILFSGAMVRALLAGTKTQTRRVVKCLEEDEELGYIFPKPKRLVHGKDDTGCCFSKNPATSRLLLELCPYGQPGERLWVREATRTLKKYDSSPPSEVPTDAPTLFLEGTTLSSLPGGEEWGRYRHARFMPRWASRLLLEVTAVRVERLRSITEADARAEGYGGYKDFYDLLSEEEQVDFDLMNEDWDDFAKREGFTYPQEWYEMLWDKIKGYGAWHANPWVWVVEFKVVEKGGQPC